MYQEQRPKGSAPTGSAGMDDDNAADADTGEREAVPAIFAPMTAADAGLASEDASVSRRTSSGIKGTPLYMAPEVLNGEPASRRSDLYSMGALLYELCTGSPPHYDPLMTLADLRRIANNQSASSLSKMVGNIDPRFATAIERCLRRNPQERYSSGEELRDALEQIAETSKRKTSPTAIPIAACCRSGPSTARCSSAASPRSARSSTACAPRHSLSSLRTLASVSPRSVAPVSCR